MTRTGDRVRRGAIIVAHGVVGWAFCGALIGFGRQFLSMDATLIIHAIGAPVGFAVLSWIYHSRFGFTRPLATASIFLGVVVTLDLFLVAMVLERSFAMFRSVIGTWLPFLLIFASTYGVGRLSGARGADLRSAKPFGRGDR